VRDPIALGTKGSVPHLPDAVVHRPRLDALLADGVRCPVTLVSSPPGAGKTTLLADWVRSGRGPGTAWLAVDAHDDRPRRLAELIVETLTRAGALRGPVGASSTGEGLLDEAYEQIMATGKPWVLVLEDVQELRSPAALRTLSYLVDRAPPTLDVVLSTRADPPIGWGRVWLNGRLGQIRHADLAFTPDETAELLAAHGVALSDEDVASLWACTEGWAAGLRLAAGALQRETDAHRFVVDAAATEATVSDYMLTEVLARESEPVRDFLLRTSVPERLTADLAVALTGDERAEELLLDVVHRGLFVTELEPKRWYRYHPLVRSLLQAHLRQSDPAATVELHRRAAAWHLANGLPDEAEAHARAAGEWALAGNLILDRWVQDAVDGDDPFVDDPVAGVATATVLHTPELAMVAATEGCRWARREEVDLYRAALDELGAPAWRPDEPRPRGSERTWETAHLLLDVSHGWAFGADDRSRAAVAAVRDLATTDPATPRLRQLALLAQAEQAIGAGELDRARVDLEDLADNAGADRHRTLAAAVLAVVDAATGLVRVADQRASAVLADLAGTSVRPTADFAHIAVALCAAQRGLRRRVSEALDVVGTPLEWSSRSLRYLDRVVRAAVAGDAPSFVRLDARIARHPLAERALVALGVLQVVDTRGRAIAVGGEGERLVLRARHQLAEDTLGRPDDAVVGWLEGSGDRHPRTHIEARVLAAIAAHRREDPAAAGRHLRDAIELSNATGITAPLLLHGAHLGSLLEWSLGQVGLHDAGAVALLDRLQHTSSEGLVEPLTEREVEVLQHLPTLMSYGEIAEGMHLSVNTVKTHLKAVYRKLGVERRREAVQRGRDLELI
jgi:LuxR family transcriptional regulator, maltose regulon positive regulatory protein